MIVSSSDRGVVYNAGRYNTKLPSYRRLYCDVGVRIAIEILAAPQTLTWLLPHSSMTTSRIARLLAVEPEANPPGDSEKSGIVSCGGGGFFAYGTAGAGLR